MRLPKVPSIDQDEPGRRERVLLLLRNSAEPRSIVSLADEIGVHPNTVRFHLETLVGAGRVEQTLGAIVGPGRPPVLYRAIRQMDPNGPTNYRLLAQMLATYLTSKSANPAAAAVELGKTWGAAIGVEVPGRPSKAKSIQVLTDVLADLGFNPEPPAGSRTSQIRLRHCPFHEVVKSHGSVICALHLGLMQGVLSEAGAPVTVSRLDAFVEPDLCIARVDSKPSE